MPLFEYECEACVSRYNADIDRLVEKLNKTNAGKVMKENPNFLYIEVTNPKTKKKVFSLGEQGKPDIRRFRYTLDEKKALYLELRNFRFSELIMDKEDEKKLKCPLCNRKKDVKRVFSTFRAILDDKSKREPRPGDDLKFHMDYKVQKEEEQRNQWVGYDHLNQYFNN